MKQKIFLALLFIVLVFSRFYNLNKTARFIWDESSDLVRVTDLVKHPRLTLIGPIDEGKTKIFSSLTYYLFLPFVAIFHSDPVSTAYSTAFFGFLTVLLFWLILKKTKEQTLMGFLLPLIFYPLLISSRWAWNPNFIPFWSVLAFLFLYADFPFHFLISGLIFGFTIHQHWYAIFSAIAIIFIIWHLHHHFRPIFQFIIGLLVSLLPFLIFDITHPPGLFLSRMLYFSSISPTNGAFTLGGFLNKITTLPFDMFNYFLHSPFSVISIFCLGLIVISLLTKRTKYNYLLLCPLGQIIGLSLIGGQVFSHYYLAAAIPFLLWIAFNHTSFTSKIFSIFVLILFLTQLPSIFTTTDWSNNITALKSITTFIAKNETPQTRFNLAVIGSPDPNTKGLRYRDLLSLQNINPQPVGDFTNLHSFYIISYQSNWSQLSKDPAYEVDLVRQKTPQSIISIPDSPWYLYRFQVNR